MNWEQKFERLTERARSEVPPQVDVASGVLRILCGGQAQPVAVTERFWMWLAAVSSAVAVPAAVFAVTTYMQSAGPLAEVAEAVSWVAQ